MKMKTFFVVLLALVFVLAAVAGDTPSGKTKTTVKSKTTCDKAKSGEKCAGMKDTGCKEEKSSAKAGCCSKDAKATKAEKSSKKETKKTLKDKE